MEQILPLLEGVYYLATTDGDQPHVRPFDAACVLDGKLYIGTLNTKRVYDQIVKNPKVEIFAMGDSGMLRFTAEAYPVEDAELNTKAYGAMGKDPATENHASIELRHIRGDVQDKMGVKTEIDF